MKIRKYLTEQFFDAFNHSGYKEIFKNPTRSEIQSIIDSGGTSRDYGGEIRFVIDFHKKDVYMWSATVTHHDTLIYNPSLVRALGMRNADDFYKGRLDDYSRIFTGYIEGKTTYSDSFLGDLRKSWAVDKISDFRAMSKYDMDWLRKYYIDPSAVKKLIERTISEIEERAKYYQS